MSGKHVGLPRIETADSFEKNWVPLYWEGSQTIGRAKVSADGKSIELIVNEGTPIAELLKEDLLDFSVSLMNKPKDEDIINKAKEKTDEQ